MLLDSAEEAGLFLVPGPPNGKDRGPLALLVGLSSLLFFSLVRSPLLPIGWEGGKGRLLFPAALPLPSLVARVSPPPHICALGAAIVGIDGNPAFLVETPGHSSDRSIRGNRRLRSRQSTEQGLES